MHRRQSGSLILALLGTAFVIVETAASAAPPSQVSVSSRQSGRWWIAETDHFIVWSKSSAAESAAIAIRSEHLRRELQQTWLEDALPAWRCRCNIVIHPNQAAYRQMLPGESGTSVGCTTITTDHGEVIFRRVDLRSDVPEWKQNALAHELTHVVLADLFPRERLPVWLNEGLAMLSEQPHLRARRDQVLQSAISSGSVPALRTLLRKDRVAGQLSPELAYAVNYSVVSYLERVGGQERLKEFAQLMIESDCDTALREVFAFTDGVEELERRWRAGVEPQPLGEEQAPRVVQVPVHRNES